MVNLPRLLFRMCDEKQRPAGAYFTATRPGRLCSPDSLIMLLMVASLVLSAALNGIGSYSNPLYIPHYSEILRNAMDSQTSPSSLFG
eukprot:scaffold645585_cov18-Prasinocladus_malaysianus.AAC.1